MQTKCKCAQAHATFIHSRIPILTHDMNGLDVRRQIARRRPLARQDGAGAGRAERAAGQDEAGAGHGAEVGGDGRGAGRVDGAGQRRARRGAEVVVEEGQRVDLAGEGGDGLGEGLAAAAVVDDEERAVGIRAAAGVELRVGVARRAQHEGRVLRLREVAVGDEIDAAGRAGGHGGHAGHGGGDGLVDDGGAGHVHLLRAGDGGHGGAYGGLARHRRGPDDGHVDGGLYDGLGHRGDGLGHGHGASCGDGGLHTRLVSVLRSEHSRRGYVPWELVQRRWQCS